MMCGKVIALIVGKRYRVVVYCQAELAGSRERRDPGAARGNEGGIEAC
jgi:hypothetical protein